MNDHRLAAAKGALTTVEDELMRLSLDPELTKETRVWARYGFDVAGLLSQCITLLILYRKER